MRIFVIAVIVSVFASGCCAAQRGVATVSGAGVDAAAELVDDPEDVAVARSLVDRGEQIAEQCIEGEEWLGWAQLMFQSVNGLIAMISRSSTNPKATLTAADAPEVPEDLLEARARLQEELGLAQAP